MNQGQFHGSQQAWGSPGGGSGSPGRHLAPNYIPASVAMAPRSVRLTYEFRGSVLGDFFNALLAGLLALVTFGLGVPWAHAMRYRWVCTRTYVNGQRLRFTGTGAGLFGNYIKWWVLAVITFGIYSIWIANRMRQWAVKHQTLDLSV